MDMESMARLMQMLMAGNNASNSGGSSENPESEGSEGSDGSSEEFGTNADTPDENNDGGFGGFFDNIDFDMISRMGELFSQMNKQDRNGELLSALKPHLREENQHKVDSAMKMSKMMTMLPFLKESGILKDFNLFN